MDRIPDDRIGFACRRKRIHRRRDLVTSLNPGFFRNPPPQRAVAISAHAKRGDQRRRESDDNEFLPTRDFSPRG
jgi:hypothetical protein